MKLKIIKTVKPGEQYEHPEFPRKVSFRELASEKETVTAKHGSRNIRLNVGVFLKDAKLLRPGKISEVNESAVRRWVLLSVGYSRMRRWKRDNAALAGKIRKQKGVRGYCWYSINDYEYPIVSRAILTEETLGFPKTYAEHLRYWKANTVSLNKKVRIKITRKEAA